MAISKNPKVIMTEQQFIDRLKVLAARRTYYKNKYPDNLCYIHNDMRTSADCVNLVKAVLNGYDVNNITPGYYQRDLSNTGDCTEAELLCQCTDVSDNFKQLGNQCAILYMKGHIGTYLGQEVNIADKIYNVIECTASWTKGILYSYIDADGVRRRYKGAPKNGQWTKYGRPTRWVNMSVAMPHGNDTNDTIRPTTKDLEALALDILAGKYGNGATRVQKLKEAGYTDAEIKQVQAMVNELCKAPTKEVYYTVKSGDIITTIAKNNGVTVDTIKKLNPDIKNMNLIYPGQKIRIR